MIKLKVGDYFLMLLLVNGLPVQFDFQTYLGEWPGEVYTQGASHISSTWLNPTIKFSMLILVDDVQPK